MANSMVALNSKGSSRPASREFEGRSTVHAPLQVVSIHHTDNTKMSKNLERTIGANAEWFVQFWTLAHLSGYRLQWWSQSDRMTSIHLMSNHFIFYFLERQCRKSGCVSYSLSTNWVIYFLGNTLQVLGNTWSLYLYLHTNTINIPHILGRS